MTTTNSPGRRQSILNAVGALVLITGLAAAGIMYWLGPSASRTDGGSPPAAAGEWKDGTIPPEDSKSVSHDIELYNGKVGLLMWKGTEALKRPETWAVLIAVGSAIVALGCFLAARRPFPEPRADFEDRPKKP